jgi:hypothetical protein
MARTTKTPHEVSRNKSGTPIVRASKLFTGRPKRTTREMSFETEQQARLFAEALNLAAACDGDWRWHLVIDSLAWCNPRKPGNNYESNTFCNNRSGTIFNQCNCCSTDRDPG